MANEKRLIDANALVRKIVEMTREPAYQHTGEDWLNGLVMAMEVVNEALTVDAVEVVRCKDCQFLDNDGCPMCEMPWDVMLTDFCSYGERRIVEEQWGGKCE